MLLRISSGMPLSAALKPSSAEVAVASFIFTSLVRPQAYADAGLDKYRAVSEMRRNHHFQAMVRTSCAHLMAFLDEVGLLTKPAAYYYRKVHML